MSFVRNLDDKIIEKLVNSKTPEGRIFKDCLYPMVMTGKVFMAVRDNTLDFYVGGNVLLSYRGSSFKYNPKIFGASRESKMIRPDKSFRERLENDFQSVRRECCNYCSDGKEQTERKIMKAYVPVFNNKKTVIVLDREIRINEDNKTKCDWLLYNTQTRKLKFVEVKLSNNSCLEMHRDGTFDVMKQLDGYSDQYNKYHDIIIAQYRNYVKILNRLLGTSLPEPEAMLDNKAGLAIFVESGGKYAHSDELAKKVSLFVGTSETPLNDIWQKFEPKR